MNDTHESNFDLYVLKLLTDSKIDAEYQHPSITELQSALATASKSQTGERGMPDFIAIVSGYVLIVEDKADRDKLCLMEGGEISQTVKATENYAVNGALWYARKILEAGTYTKIFAFGCAGSPKHHTMRPVFVDADTVKMLPEIETFGNFAPDNVDEYYRRAVLGEEMPEELQSDQLRKKAETLHEHLRNYGKLGETEKPLVVSAILLALTEQDHGFSLSQLKGDDVNTDGNILYTHLVNSLKRAKVSPQVKLAQVIAQFSLVNNRPALNEIPPSGGIKTTPLKYFAEYLNKEIYSAIRLGNSPKDYLGMFYSEFVKYSGGDGKGLGVVLTPSHITELFCDLVDLKYDDVIFDPCCGTGGFLVAGMHRMLQLSKNDTQRRNVKEHQIFGIEVRDDMFAIATTNMILRGDGQSNLVCADFMKANPADIQLNGVTVGFMNPPYSQAKNKSTAHLSELNFISHLLDCILSGGRAAVIVPVSTMIGKTKDDRQLKADILRHHTLEGVISLNKDTFYGVGTVPCIAVFTAGHPHPAEKLVKFINFQDDGYEVKMHRGLVETERAKDRRQYMLDCWRGKIADAPSDFMVETAIEAGDEWLHSFYYYNDEIPGESDFAESLADYLTFEFSMTVRGRGYLFAGNEGRNDAAGLTGDLGLEGVKWGKFSVAELFRIESGRCKNAGELERDNMGVPYVGATNRNNGVLDFVKPVEGLIMKGNCIAFVKQGEGSVGYSVYKHEDFIASTAIAAGYSPFLNRYTGIFVTVSADKVRGKYSFNYPRSDSRLKKEMIQLPIDSYGNPDWGFMERYMRRRERAMIEGYISRVRHRISGREILTLEGVKWGKFRIGDLFRLEQGKCLKSEMVQRDDNGRGITYLGATNSNNAVTGYVKYDGKLVQKGNCIAFIKDGEGSAGYAVYKAEDFIANFHIIAGYAPFINRYTGTFITTAADMVRGKYSFNYSRNMERLKNEVIQLPVDSSGNPDWGFMESYMRQEEQRLLHRYVDGTRDKLRMPPPPNYVVLRA